MKFSSIEIKELMRAWLLLSIAFAILFFGFSFDYKFVNAVLISGLTVGTGFLLHELSHKYVAQKYGCHAEFRAFDKMLWIAVLLSFFGFIFAAPGAVFINGRINAIKNGHISIAGPLTNIILGILFFALILLSNEPTITQIFTMGMHVNFILATFNMLPFFGLDGAKVLAWNKTVYSIVLGISIFLTFFDGALLQLF